MEAGVAVNCSGDHCGWKLVLISAPVSSRHQDMVQSKDEKKKNRGGSAIEAHCVKKQGDVIPSGLNNGITVTCYK